ncbi:hypothetical protein AAKU67_003403 [Oxalobacteraceae bacterium GrIS 2.11]
MARPVERFATAAGQYTSGASKIVGSWLFRSGTLVERHVKEAGQTAGRFVHRQASWLGFQCREAAQDFTRAMSRWAYNKNPYYAVMRHYDENLLFADPAKFDSQPMIIGHNRSDGQTQASTGFGALKPV